MEVGAFAEAVESGVAASPTGYTTCAHADAYAGLYAPPSGSRTVTGVDVWTGDVSAGGGWRPTTDGGCTDTGVQRVHLTVQVGDASETLNVVIRRPCRPSDVNTQCA